MTLATALLALNLAQPYPPYPPPPPYYPPPPPRQYPAPPPQAYAPRGMVGLVLMPLGTSSLSSDVQGYQTYSDPHAAVALELRGQRGGGRLRLGAEFTPHDRILDVSLKYNFLDRTPLQPFLTVGLGAGNLGPETVWRGTFSVSVGVDFYLTKDFFFTAEAKGRAFADLSPQDPNNVYGSGVTMGTALFGVGVYF
ncbi:MAG TPA: hypothetical protein VLD85_12540 [Anaeromyxobacteraceae bacterium]|nr:hypothetical protein [Anaeromyxobacteraceae bacterium]